ncbi:hypothetical protein Zmor_024558 [Zophobas morio]|uniref:Uncharacterized protein n=1 Tax=Zophobas morio TaxID=2755281 RepID=A0AA38I3G5_9CUCU|nr:hypothetical protein Zmor_024558 [Zophobas morio]
MTSPSCSLAWGAIQCSICDPRARHGRLPLSQWESDVRTCARKRSGRFRIAVSRLTFAKDNGVMDGGAVFNNGVTRNDVIRRRRHHAAAAFIKAQRIMRLHKI